MRKLFLLVGIGAALFGAEVHAEWKTSFNADVSLEGLYWNEGKLGEDPETFRGIGTLKTPFSLRSGRKFRLRLLPIVQWDPQNVNKNERLFRDLQEGFVQFQASGFTAQVGMNVQTWGDTDVFNPLDVVSARRYYDPFRSEKLGAPTVLVKKDFDTFFIEALYIPEQRETLIPGPKSRWLPREVYSSRSIVTNYGTGTVVLPPDLSYHYAPSIYLNNALQNNAGARVKFRFSGFDWTIAGFHGASTAPSVNIRQISLNAIRFDNVGNTASLQVDRDVYLRPVFYRTRMLGTSFVWVAGPILVKGASAQTRVIDVPATYDSQVPGNTWEHVLGVEKGLPLGDGSLTVLLQGTYVNRGDRLDTNSVSLARMFDKAAMMGLRWAPTENITVLGSFLRDLHFKGNLVHSEASFKLADGYSTKIMADILSGPTETPIGTYRKNDRITASLNAQF